jgi:hypothetical protein
MYRASDNWQWKIVIRDGGGHRAITGKIATRNILTALVEIRYAGYIYNRTEYDNSKKAEVSNQYLYRAADTI